MASSKSGCGSGCAGLIALCVIGAVVSSYTRHDTPTPAGTSVPPAGVVAAGETPPPPEVNPRSFIGLTEQELISRLGEPLSVTNDQSPDGPFKMLIYDQTPAQETFFTIFADDGVVYNCTYRGRAIQH